MNRFNEEGRQAFALWGVEGMTHIYIVSGTKCIEGEWVTAIVKAFKTWHDAELFAIDMMKDEEYGFSDYGIGKVELL